MDTNESLGTSSSKETGDDEKLLENELKTNNTGVLPLPETLLEEGNVKPVDTIEGKDNALTPSDAKVDSSLNIIESVEKEISLANKEAVDIENQMIKPASLVVCDITEPDSTTNIPEQSISDILNINPCDAELPLSQNNDAMPEAELETFIPLDDLVSLPLESDSRGLVLDPSPESLLQIKPLLTASPLPGPSGVSPATQACIQSTNLEISVKPSQPLPSHKESNKPSASPPSPSSRFEPIILDDSKNVIPHVAKVLETEISDEKLSLLPSSIEGDAVSSKQISLVKERVDVNKVCSTNKADPAIVLTDPNKMNTEEQGTTESTSVLVEDSVLTSMVAEKINVELPNSAVPQIENSEIEASKTTTSEIASDEHAPKVEENKVESVLLAEKSSIEMGKFSVESTLGGEESRATKISVAIEIVQKMTQEDKPILNDPKVEPNTQQDSTKSPTNVEKLVEQTKPDLKQRALETELIPESVMTKTERITEELSGEAEPTDSKLTAEPKKPAVEPILIKITPETQHDVADALPSAQEQTSENSSVPIFVKPPVEALPFVVEVKKTVEAKLDVVDTKPDVVDTVLEPPLEKASPVIHTLPYSSLKLVAPAAVHLEKVPDSKPETKLSTTLKAKAEKDERSQETKAKFTKISVAHRTPPPTIIKARSVSQEPLMTKPETPAAKITTIKAVPITQQVAEPDRVAASILSNIETAKTAPITPSSKPEVVPSIETVTPSIENKTPKVTAIHIKPIPEPVPENKSTEITVESPTTSRETIPPITLSKSLMVKSHTSEPVSSTRLIIRPITTSSAGETIKKLNIKPIIQPPTSPVKPEPIPRLIIKPVSSTRSVVESLPPRKSAEESKIQLHVVPATSGTGKESGTSRRFEITSAPAKTAAKETSQVTVVPKVEPLTLKRLATDQGHAVVLSKIVCSQASLDTKTTSKISETKTVDTFTIYNADSPKSGPLISTNIQKDEGRLEPAATLDVVEEKEKLLPEAMDFEGDSFIDEASLNDASLPASLGDNEDFSFIKPKSADLVDEVVNKNGTVPFIEEDTQSSWSLDPNKLPVAKLKDCVDQTAKAIDEESRDSVGSVGSKKSTKEASTTSHSASGIFEYQWPPEKGEFYILQEQLCEFLGVKSFKRKHPDLPRRNVDKEERVFLKEKNVVSETQCDLGLTALRSEDVMELMAKDYSDKYRDYVRVQQEKQRQAIAIKNKEYAAANLDKNKIRDLLKKAMKSAAEYNAHLNQERRDERKMSFDLQTYTIHVPASKKRKLEQDATKVGKYPVALLPGQYQDYYRKYTSNELKYLPLNTVLYGPLQELSSISVPPGSDGSNSDSDGSDSEASCCSSSLGTQDGSGGDSSSGSETATTAAAVKNDVYFKPKDVPSPCKICHGNHELNKQSQPEELIHCSQCKTSAHPSCLELPTELVSVIKTYEWQCMECKTCMLCMDPYDEEKMMFCDKCDRGFHTFCVGLKTLPSGRWICQLCGQCALCGSKTPGPEGTKLQWQQAAGEGNKKPQLLCVACSKKKAK